MIATRKKLNNQDMIALTCEEMPRLCRVTVLSLGLEIPVLDDLSPELLVARSGL